MIRVVLDTNVLVSAVRAESGPLATIREGWLTGRFQVYVSEPILDEVDRTLTKPYFADRLGPDRTRRFLSLLRRTAVLQAITDPVSGVATHPEDDLRIPVCSNTDSDGSRTRIPGEVEHLFRLEGEHALRRATRSGGSSPSEPQATLLISV